ncbi:phosphoribosylanthranilate isomerase [Calycomorphotria hydatis]|nr:phosphoribosylanthranilate isomerase [Calycomorphotria hydatis]
MWVKICGIKNSEVASQLAKLPIDALGLNFFEKSTRCVDVPTAAEIVSLLPPSILPVGLFVNHKVDFVIDTAQELSLPIIQLHGDESPVELSDIHSALPDTHIVRAFRLGSDGFAPLERYLEECDALGCTPWACLIDAAVPGQYGGTGQTVSWDRVRDEYRDDWPHMILAGGLTPDNIREAISTAAPWGVDVAGGVESAPGVKDIDRASQFVRNARS